LAFLKPGDHILLSDASYEPVRNFCKHQLADLGISHTFYPPDGNGVEALIQPNTKVLYVECPGTITYDMLDLPRISEIAKKSNLWVIADNTWGSGWLYQPLALGADVSITAITKYIGGHSDLMMGASVANERAWPALQKATYGFGQTVGADDAFMALRGVRSMPIRLQAHAASALLVAQWLESRTEIAHVFCPALPNDPGHALWKKHCHGTNGLISFELQKRYSQAQAEGVIDALALFGLGASWGGFESLVIPTDLAGTRVLTDWSQRGAVVRLHIGLEDTEDLIADLNQALNTLS
jgi:cystathionine beta-lyase